MTGVHLAAAVLAVVTCLGLLTRRERLQGSTRFLFWATVGTVPWTLSVTLVKAEGIHPWHQMLWFPSIAFSGGAMLLWAGCFARYDWRPSNGLVAMWLGVPALMLALRVLWGLPSRDPLFVANTVYSFGVLVVMTVWVSQRANDPVPLVRTIARGFLATSIVILIAEAFRLNVTDIVASLVLALLAATTLVASDRLRVRPSPDVLIDDLGALLFVFDHDQRLVDLNAPARLFYTLRGSDPPERGSLGAELLGTDLGTVDAILVELRAGTDLVRFSGYVQRLPSHGTPSRGWVCLLRRSSLAAAEGSPRSSRLAVMNRLPAYDPDTRVLSARSFDQALASAAAYPRAGSIPATALVLEAEDQTALAQAARAVSASWEHRLETVAVGRCGELRLALVARDVSQEALGAWAEQVLDETRVRLVTRSGTVEHAPALVDAALGEIDAGRRRPRPT